MFPASMKAVAPKDTPLEIARRRRLRTMVRSANRLAQQSGSSRARQVAGFIEAHAELASPIVGRALSYPARPSSMTFHIAPIISSDGILPSSDEYVRMFAQTIRSRSAARGCAEARRTEIPSTCRSWSRPVAPVRAGRPRLLIQRLPTPSVTRDEPSRLAK
jgi:hypothetical protein